MTSIAAELRSEGKRTGLVLTSGALHEGQLSLMNRARELCDAVIVSIFANPLLDEGAHRPPVDLPRDAELAFTRGVDFIFAPAPDDFFADGFSTSVTVEGLSEKLEGTSRPGYFARSLPRQTSCSI